MQTECDHVWNKSDLQTLKDDGGVCGCAGSEGSCQNKDHQLPAVMFSDLNVITLI